MIIDTLFEHGMCTLIPRGRIDSSTSGDFQHAMDYALGKTKNIMIDFKEAEYISSSGLRVLLSAKKALGNAGSIAITNCNQAILEILDLTGFSDLFDVDRNTTLDASQMKAIFFDVDGTLLSHTTKIIPESAKRAIKEVREKGLKVFIASGRDMHELQKILEINGDMKFDGYLTLNGNVCINEKGEMFAGNEIDQGEVEILVNIFRAGTIPFVLIGEKERYINYVDDVVIETQEATQGTIPDIGEYKGEKIYQCLAFVDSEMRNRLENLLDQCSITSWNERGIDIIAKTGGKAAGIQKVIDIYKIKRSETMAFGDGENDLSMLKFAGIGVAMGNGVDKVKQNADYVTSSIDEDGIYNAFKHFKLID